MELVEVATEDPEVFISVLSLYIGSRNLDEDGLMQLADVFVGRGINVFRILAEHPDAREEHFPNVDQDGLESLADKVDREMPPGWMDQ